MAYQYITKPMEIQSFVDYMISLVSIYGCQLDDLRLPWPPLAMYHLVSFMCIRDVKFVFYDL